jgi:hypothetical protein
MKRLIAAAVPMRLRGRFRRLHPDHAIAARAFDSAFYLKTYPDVGEVGADPLDHFMTYGWREGRDPSPEFSVRAYLEAFPEVGEAGVNPFVHPLRRDRAPEAGRGPDAGALRRGDRSRGRAGGGADDLAGPPGRAARHRQPRRLQRQPGGPAVGHPA